jgi:hypothetical protein
MPRPQPNPCDEKARHAEQTWSFLPQSTARRTLVKTGVMRLSSDASGPISSVNELPPTPNSCVTASMRSSLLGASTIASMPMSPRRTCALATQGLVKRAGDFNV